VILLYQRELKEVERTKECFAIILVLEINICIGIEPAIQNVICLWWFELMPETDFVITCVLLGK